MTKRITGFLLCLLALVLAACSDSGGGGSGGNKQNHDETKTWVRFVNNNDFSVNIYSDRLQQVKITEAGAKSQSISVQTEPNSSGALFYPVYHIVIDDVSIPFEGEAVIARIDAGKTSAQPNIVTIPSLEELGAEELAKPLSTDTYLKIQNDGSSSLLLLRGNNELLPEGSSSTILNGGETGLYRITAGLVSGFSLRRNTVTPVDFPGGLTEFVSSRLYSFRFNGSSLILLTEKQLTLTQAFSLSPPENINARSLPSGNISLSWERVGTESSYRLYRSEGSPDNFSFLASTDNTSYTDSTVIVGNTYFYKLTSIKNNLESERSANYAMVMAEQTYLSAPTGFYAEVLGTDSIHLSWYPVEDATAYNINRGFTEGNINTFVVITASTSYTISGLEANTGYYFTVSAISSHSESLASQPVYAMTSQVPSIQPPGGLNASALSSSSIQVSWSGVSGATGYRVYRSYSAAGYYDFVGSVSISPYTDNGLSAGTTYYYKVSSVKDYQESDMSWSYASATTQTGGGTIQFPPTTPAGLVVTNAYSGSISLSWNSVSTANSYNVYRSNTQTGAEAKITSSPITGTSYTDNVPSGASYYYKVTGVNSSGESPKSAAAFGFAATHYTLSYHSSAQTLSLTAGDRHYYRLAVSQGQSYTIEWQNGNNQNYGSYVYASAWQNDGTLIFNDANNGYTNPRVFTAATTGFVTVMVRNSSSSTSYNYQVYYY